MSVLSPYGRPVTQCVNPLSIAVQDIFPFGFLLHFTSFLLFNIDLELMTVCLDLDLTSRLENLSTMVQRAPE